MLKKQLSAVLQTVSSAKVRIGATILLFMLFVTVFSFFVTAKTVYIITDGEETTVVESYAVSATDVLKQAGIHLTASDIVSINDSGDATEVLINRSQLVTVEYDGAACSILAYNSEAVSDILSRLGIEVSSLDIVSVDTNAMATSGMLISVTRKMIYYQESSEPIAFSTEKIANHSKTKGFEAVIQTGKNGVKTLTFEIIYIDGEQSSRQLIKEEVSTAPVPEIIEYGTKVTEVSPSDTIASVTAFSSGGMLTMNSGATLDYSKVLTCIATAYTTEGKRYTTTATGTTARYGAIAVDPKVIPYGTKMYIVSNDGNYIYGIAVAEDCGGSIKGNKIDLFYNTYNQCITFGRRSCTVYILK